MWKQSSRGAEPQNRCSRDALNSLFSISNLLHLLSLDLSLQLTKCPVRGRPSPPLPHGRMGGRSWKSSLLWHGQELETRPLGERYSAKQEQSWEICGTGGKLGLA